jgi:hypothetical protein
MTSQLLINEPPIQVLPALARAVGLNEAIVLQQIHYWLNLQFSRHLSDDRHRVCYSPKQWERQFSFWDKKTLHRAINNLGRLEVVISYEAPDDLKKTTYYTIDYRALGQVTSGSKSQSSASSSMPTYDHANFDAINFDEREGDNR